MASARAHGRDIDALKLKLLVRITVLSLPPFPSPEGDGVADVRDDLLFLPDVAVQPVHPSCSGSCHLHS